MASPECTNHSVAGAASAPTRNRICSARFCPTRRPNGPAPPCGTSPVRGSHRYQAVIVENVVDAWHWEPFGRG
ncbi:gp65 domain protein [Mycobacterium xenopi 3993]|nr:gp65 domain protein [Mycobacterium xenopi 3993]